MEQERGSIDGSGLSFGGLTEFLGRSAEDAGGILRPGNRLGDVAIIRLVGEGGMGRVYEGLQGTPCRTVAVKVMRPGVLSRAAARRFEHEAHILGRLTHPGIARIYSVGMEQLSGETLPYFVMEYIDEGRPITDHAAERGLSIHDRVRLFREACQAVAHGHQKGIIHRDIKPGNILVDALGQPKIIDFGVARSTDGDLALTTLQTDAGQLVGTLRYMCPEQFDGSSDDLDVRADVYALGLVLYELLAGRPPYDLKGRAVYEVARVVREVEPTPLSVVNPKLRGDLDTIVTKCLEKDRSQRYSSAAELEADLGRHLRGEPIAARPPRLLESLVRLARRHRLAATAAVGIAAAIAVAFVGISIFAVRAERQRVIAVDARKQADDASQEAAKQLYVANLRSLQAAVEKRNLRLARQLHAENLAIAGTPPPLEMHVLGEGLDDALAVMDPQHGPVGEIAYGPDGGILAAMALVPPKLSPSRQNDAFIRNPSAMLHYKVNKILFFTVDGRQPYAPLEECEEDWVKLWRAGVGGAENLAGMEVGEGVPLAVSPDGLRLAVHDEDGRIRVVNRSTKDVEVESVLAEHRGRVKRAMFGPGGTRLAVELQNATVGLWDAGTGRLIARFGDKDVGIQTFQFSPDGSRIAIIENRRTRSEEVRVHGTADGRHLSTVTKPRGLASAKASLLAFSPDGGRLVTTSHQTDLHLWDVATGSLIALLEGHVGVVTAVAFDAQDRQIASGATNGNIRLWDAKTGAFQRELMGHDGAILALSFRPDQETLASGSHDGTVRIWSCTSPEPLAVLPGLRGMTAVAFSPNGEQLAVAPQGAGEVELWNARTVERLFACDVSGGVVAQLAYHPEGTLVAAACKMPDRPGEVRVWKTDTGTLVATLGGHGNGAERLAFSPDGTHLVTVSRDSVATVWDVPTGRRLTAIVSEYKGPFVDADAVFVFDGSRVNYRSAELFDAATGDVVAKVRPKGHVTCAAGSPDGRLLATGVASGTVYLDDTATGKHHALLIGHSERVLSIAFSADGSRVLTGALDGTARLWDAVSGAEIRLFRGHESSVDAAIFTPDGRRIVTGATDGTIRIWDAERGQELCEFPGQLDFPRAFALSPDGMLLVAAASDGPVRIWGLSNAAVTRSRAAAAAARSAEAPRARRETPRDRRDPAG